VLKSLEIQNFKGIRQGKLDDLAQVNILVGRNNSGKSTILDALILLRCGIVQVDHLNVNGLEQIIRRRVNSGNLNFDEFWFQMKTETPIALTTQFNDDHKLGEEWVSYGGPNPPGGTFTLNDSSAVSTDNPRAFDINAHNNYRAKDNRHIRSWKTLCDAVGEENVQYLSQVQFLDTNVIHTQVNEDFWYELSKDRGDKKLIQMLNEIYQTDIEQRYRQ
jgi:hypothetical protein